MSCKNAQNEIESAMQSFELLQCWECIQLYSSEGLLMASCGQSPFYTQDHLLEFSFSLIETVRLLEDAPIKEIVVRSAHHRRLVFRYFNTDQDILILAAVLHTRKGYKRAMTKLIKAILNTI
jgi:hypothetical protein